MVQVSTMMKWFPEVELECAIASYNHLAIWKATSRLKLCSLGSRGKLRAEHADGPPAKGTTKYHKETTIPDQRDQRIDKDLQSCLTGGSPVGQENIDIGQAESRNRDLAGRLIAEMSIDSATRIDIAL